jgi:hypothetical protein
MGPESWAETATLSYRLRNLPRSPVLVAAAVIVLAFLFGGSARADVTSLLWLRPISIFLLAWAAWTVRPDDLRDHKFVFAMTAAIVALVALSLIPLPPAVWQSLPGREVVVRLDQATGLDPVWRPLTMTPSHALNALYSLALPAALVLILAQLHEREIHALLAVAVAMLGLSALLGVLQAAGLPLDFYQIDNPVAGLFANRNHQGLAIACFLPMITMIATRDSKHLSRTARRRRHGLLLAVGLALIPLIFVTGSRAGLVLGGMGLLLAVFLWQSSAHFSMSRAKAVLTLASFVVITVGVVATVLVASDRNLVVQRLIAKDISNELRVPIWRTTSELAGQYMPLGSGPGSFVEVFQIGENSEDLVPRYVNHAHNDFLEVALTGGFPSIILIFLAVVAFANCAWRLSRARGMPRDARRYRWLGLGVIVLCAAASVVDYPLRTPALACLFVFAVFLASGGKAAERSVTRTGD